MREIKFRAWDESTQEMHYPEDHKHDTIRTASAHMLKHFDCVMQFTGLKDKNGKPIYEGDILEYKSDECMVVIWHPKFASFGLRKEGWAYTHFFGEAIEDSDKCEVIGNIHQHQNLLTK